MFASCWRRTRTPGGLEKDGAVERGRKETEREGRAGDAPALRRASGVGRLPEVDVDTQ